MGGPALATRKRSDMPSTFKIGSRSIGEREKPFIIAELSGNHQGSLDRALQLVDAAAEAGADAVKLQTYTADTMTLNIRKGEFVIDDPKSPWSGRSLYDLYQEASTPWDWHPAIFERARSCGLECFSSPFDETAVDYLESLNVPAYKIASFELTDLRLVRRVALTGKPIIMSTGMATVAEIGEAVQEARKAGAEQIVLLKCTSTYPSTPENSHIRTIPYLAATFGCHAGLSDHTLGTGVAVASVALGARVIEKHFTLRRADGGPDATFSMEPKEFAALVTEAERAWQALGEVRFGPTRAEEASLRYRRSLYISADVRKGEILNEANVRAVRPGLGLPTKFFDLVIGRPARADLAAGTPVTWDLLG